MGVRPELWDFCVFGCLSLAWSQDLSHMTHMYPPPHMACSLAWSQDLSLLLIALGNELWNNVPDKLFLSLFLSPSSFCTYLDNMSYYIYNQ